MAKKLHLTFEPGTEVTQSGDIVTLSSTATIMGREINKLRLDVNDALQLTFKMEFDAGKIAKKGGPPSRGKPSWTKALVKSVLSEAAKEAVKDVISSIFQSDRLPQSN